MAKKTIQKEKEFIFRIDDISINTNKTKISEIIEILFENYKNVKVILGISALVSEIKEEKKERVFPEIWNALSDHSCFYFVDKCGVPENLITSLRDKYTDRIFTAGHGLIHVDHRLLSEEAQRMSILASCSLAKSDIFIPPFNKWNEITEYICQKNQIQLIKFETGWKHLLYNNIDKSQSGLYYFHSHDFNSVEDFKKKISG